MRRIFFAGLLALSLVHPAVAADSTDPITQMAAPTQMDMSGADIVNAGDIGAVGSVSAPVFYDANAPAYRVDPAGTSAVKRMLVESAPLTDADVATKAYVDEKWDADFESSLTPVGFQKLPTGFMFEWGAVAVPHDTNLAVAFPKPYTTAAFSVTLADTAPQFLQECSVKVISKTKTGFVIQNAAGKDTVAYWMAVGK